MQREAHGIRLPRTAIAVVALLAAALPPAQAALPDARPPAASEPALTEPAPPGQKPKPVIELPRGQLLYENHCQGCHQSSLHIRNNRRAKTVAELRGWVLRWSGELRLGWAAEEIEDVVQYLNRRFYKLAPPADESAPR